MKGRATHAGRYLLVLLALGATLGVIAVQLVMLHFGLAGQVPKRPKYSFTKEVTGVYALRGKICASDGLPLAQSVMVWNYHVDPKAVKPKEQKVQRMEIITNVAAQLSLPVSKVMDAYCQTKSRYYYLTTSDDGAAHEALSGYRPRQMVPKAPGLVIEEKNIRSYPQGRLASQIVGFVSKDPTNSVGSAGIEQRYERFLRGTPGEVVGEQDARGGELRERRIRSVDARRGADVYLTLNHEIQLEVERALEEACASNNTEVGWALVMGARTGAILAMASLPDYSPSRYNKYAPETRKNRVISENYEPGSVMKPITACAALEEGICTPESVYDAGKGIWFYLGRPLRDHPTGLLTVREAIAKSSNIVFAKIGLELGPERLWKHFRAMGFGAKTGLELPGEETGILRHDDLLKDGLKPTRVPIGQGVCVTALQLANAYCAIANGGALMKPYIVDRVVQDDGTIIEKREPTVVGHPMTPKTARRVREMMRSVTEKGGTGRRATVRGYSVAGKTGTAQMKEGKGYSSTKYYATFVGMIPASDPEVVILVTLANPQPKHTGGEVSCPVFRRIATTAMKVLEVEPDMPEEIPEDMAE